MLEIEEALRRHSKSYIVLLRSSIEIANTIIKFQRETDASAIRTFINFNNWTTPKQGLKQHLEHIKERNNNFRGVRVFPIDGAIARVVYYF